MSTEDQEVRDWVNRAVKASAPGIEESQVFTALVTENYMKDPLCALQLGLAILMEKPIFLLVDRNQKIPEGLVRAAKHIERVNPDDSVDMTRAIAEMGKFVKALSPEHCDGQPKGN